MNPCGPGPLFEANGCPSGPHVPVEPIIHSPLMTPQQMLDIAYDAMPDPPYLQDRFPVEPIKPLIDPSLFVKPTINYGLNDRGIGLGSSSSELYSKPNDDPMLKVIQDMMERERERQEALFDSMIPRKPSYRLD